MDFTEYQNRATKTAIYPGRGGDLGLYYTALGLSNEGGEVAGKVKKYIRDGEMNPTEVAKELGDVLWYVAMVANELRVDLSTVAEDNLSKLASRSERGVLGGSGDNR